MQCINEMMAGRGEHRDPNKKWMVNTAETYC